MVVGWVALRVDWSVPRMVAKTVVATVASTVAWRVHYVEG